MGVGRWLISLLVNFDETLLMQKRNCGNSFGCSRAQIGTFAGKCRLVNLLPTLPVIVADWLWNLTAGNTVNQKTSPVTKRALLSFRGWATVLSGSGILMYSRTLKVSLT